MNSFLIFLKKLSIATLMQVFFLFGAIIFFGLILYILAKFTRTTFIKSVGQKADIFFTGWIGTPVHELGHAVFCLLFFHKIDEIALFKPDTKNGTLGYVTHSYNKKNIYHKIGNFFIGIGPLLLGSFVLLLIIYFFFPDSKILNLVINNKINMIIGLDGFKIWIINAYHLFADILFLLFTFKNIATWQFWVFMYISISIASHMELSIADLKGALFGFITIIILMVIINSIAILTNSDVTQYAITVSEKTEILTNVLICATVLSSIGFLIIFIVLNIISLIRKKGLVRPF